MPITQKQDQLFINALGDSPANVHHLLITAVPKSSIEGEETEEKTIRVLAEHNNYATSIAIVRQVLGPKWTAWETIEVSN